MNKPFAGIRILDFTRYVAGPFGTYQFALLGADVIKVEPKTGDDMRRSSPVKWEGSAQGLGPSFLGINSNKRPAESRKFRKVASHSLLGWGRIDCGRSTSARRNGSVAMILRSDKRCSPCTITRTLFSDCLTSLSTSAAVPTVYRSCGVGSSFVSSR